MNSSCINVPIIYYLDSENKCSINIGIHYLIKYSELIKGSTNYLLENNVQVGNYLHMYLTYMYTLIIL